MPKDIEEIAFWLLNEPFSTSFKCNLSYIYQYDPSNNSLSNVCFLICLDISDMKMRKGLALVDIIREVTMFVFKIQMPSDVRVKLINDLADIEYRLSFACNDKLQLGALISTFTNALTAMVAAAS